MGKAVNDRFRSSLAQYQIRSNLTVENLALFLEVAPATVYNWLSGRNAPTKANLPGLCRRLGLNHDDLFTPAALLDHKLECQFLSLEALSNRYRNLADQDSFQGHTLRGMAAVSVLTRVLQMPRQAWLTIAPNYEIEVRIDGPVAAILRFEGNRAEGITYRMHYENSPLVKTKAFPLNEVSVKTTLDGLKDHGKSNPNPDR